MLRYIFLLFATCALHVFAVPVKPEWHSHKQPDGTMLQVMLCGDEHLHYYKTIDNVPLVRDSIGNFYYAQALGFGLTSTGVLAHNPEQRSESEMVVISQEEDVRQLRRYSPRKSMPQQTRMQRRTKTRAISDGKEKRGLVVMVSFTDRTFSSDTATVVWNNILNAENFKGYGAYGSVHDYFLDQSYGQFNLKFDLAGPVQLPKSCYYYGQNNPINNDDIDIHMDELIVTACKEIDKDINFKDYDWDGDGYVDQIFFLYAGWGEAVYGADSRLIWPHEYWLHGYKDYPFGLTLDGVIISHYACGSEMSGRELVSKSLSGIGTFCHEFSHCLGLPDFYTYTGIDIMGEWDIMSGGNYNGDGWCPPNYLSYERELCGWITPMVLDKPASIVDMKPLSDFGQAYKIVNDALDKSKDEYYLLENRQKTGWDKFVPGHGMVVLHVDYDEEAWFYNTVNDVYSHPRMTIIPANNSYLSAKASGFAYPYLANDSLTDRSYPVAKVFNANAKGKYMGKPITKIREYDGLIAFDFMGGGVDSGIEDIHTDISAWEGKAVEVYDMTGKKLYELSSFSEVCLAKGNTYILRDKKGKTIKINK